MYDVSSRLNVNGVFIDFTNVLNSVYLHNSCLYRFTPEPMTKNLVDGGLLKFE